MISERSTTTLARAVVLTMATLFFAAAAVVAIVAFRAQRVAVPADLRFDLEPASQSAQRALTYHDGRSFVPPLTLAAGKPGLLPLGALPHGAELTLVGWRGMARRYALIEVAIGDRAVGLYNGQTGGRAGILAHGARLRLKKTDSGSEVSFLLSKSPYWTGFILVQPQPKAAQFARWALPLSSVMVLLALAWFRPRPAVFLPALVTVLGCLYWHTLATTKVAPMADYFFSDSLDFVMPLTRGQFTSDMAKHLLFFPLARGLFRFFSLVGLPELTAMTALFVTFGVANAALAWGWMSRMLPGPRSAALLAVVHAFCFAPWAFASHFETYAASSAAANGVLWLLSRGTIRTALVDTLLQGGAGAVAALLHPPLLILQTLGVLRYGGQPIFKRLLRTGATIATAIAVYVTAGFALRHVYGTPVDKALIKADTSSDWSTFASYAKPESRTARHAATVINGQCALAFAGVGFPVEWDSPGAPARGYGRTFAGWIAGFALLAFWVVGLSGAWSDRQILQAHLAGAALVVAPTLLFYWLFNPSEMLLYSPPLVGALLVGLAGGWIALLGERRAVVGFTVFAFALALHNGLCLASFP